MKLIHKFTLWYLLVTFFVLIIGGILSYHAIKTEVDREQARYLKKNIDFTVEELSNGIFPDSLSQNRMEIVQLDTGLPEINFFVRDTMVWRNYLKRMEPQVKVSASRVINNQHYYISTYGAIVDTKDITDAVVKSISGIFLMMLVMTGFASMLISKKILTPFNKTLKAMKSFRIRQKEPLQLLNAHTQEFNKLNSFFEGMTAKAQQDYQSLKEFTENASHELQTPLAIIMGKLELLMESELNDHQARLIISAQNAVEKLRKLGQSLALLTKLDNQEFESSGTLNFSDMLKESLFAFEELIEMKSLRLELDVEEDVLVNIHPMLTNILLNNLLSNAIRHNVKEGVIHVKLSADRFSISNTGKPLNVPPSEMFNRFRKHDQSSDFIGLGLAIVKQICEQSNMNVQYDFKQGIHMLQVSFKMLSNSD